MRAAVDRLAVELLVSALGRLIRAAERYRDYDARTADRDERELHEALVAASLLLKRVESVASPLGESEAALNEFGPAGEARRAEDRAIARDRAREESGQ